MKLVYILIMAFLMAGCQSSGTNDTVTGGIETEPDYDALQKVLEDVYDLDQGVRDINWDSFTSPEESIAYSKRMMAVDSANQTIVIPIIEKHGWLPASKIGEKASKAIYYVIQHASLETIEKYLPQMEALAEQGEASPQDAATMRDRLLMFQGKKQIYGTQAGNWVREEGGMIIWPIEDAENVNKRRKEAGFTTTVEENAGRLGAIYDPYEVLPKHVERNF